MPKPDAPTAEAAPERAFRSLPVILGDFSLTLVTRAGFPDWGHLGADLMLIANAACLVEGERVLVSPSGHGVLGAWAAARLGAGAVTCAETHAIALEATRRTLQANGHAAALVVAGLPPPDAVRPYDVALMPLPKGRDLARLHLRHLYNALRPGGRLYLAGANDAGIKSVINDARALFGQCEPLAYKAGQRVALATKIRPEDAPLPPEYDIPGLRPGTYHRYTVQVGERVYTLETLPGVFSWEHLDAGTAALLPAMIVRPDDAVLDVGCGCGILGLHASALAPRGHATLVDVDLLATGCAAHNLALIGVENAHVLAGDGLTAVPGERFTLIVSNPPFHVGHAVDLAMARRFIHEAYLALERHGRLVLVANRFLAYQRLMSERFGNVSVLSASPQYHVLSATHP